jgi:hypothetical protein
MRPFRVVLLVVWSVAGCSEPKAIDHRPAPKLLFEELPPKIREHMFPMREIDLASSLDQAELDQHKTLPASLKAYASPGSRMDGWICQVKYAAPREGEGAESSKDDPPGTYYFALLLPQPLAGWQVWIVGDNYDPKTHQPSIPGSAFQEIKGGDWVRVGGVFREDSKLEWRSVKSSEYLPPGTGGYLSLGHITVSSLEKLTK